jgi:hypothetical protein
MRDLRDLRPVALPTVLGQRRSPSLLGQRKDRLPRPVKEIEPVDEGDVRVLRGWHRSNAAPVASVHITISVSRSETTSPRKPHERQVEHLDLCFGQVSTVVAQAQHAGESLAAVIHKGPGSGETRTCP